MVECIVEYDYEAQEEDELTLKVGDVITDVIKQDGGWWEGKLAGRHGAFPDNFVKVIEKKHVTHVSSKEQKSRVASISEKSRVASISDKLGKEGGIRMGPPPPGLGVVKKPAVRKLQATVLHSYTPAAGDELALTVGDIVDILKQEEEGWWEGRLHGKVGMFPSNFVQVMEPEMLEGVSTATVDEAKEEKSTEEPTSPSVGPKAVNRKPTGGVGLGNIFGDGPVKLRHKGGPKKAEEKSSKDVEDSNKILEPKKLSAKDPLPASDHKKPVRRAKALYSYVAENDDELSLSEGDIITVTDMQLEDSGWWQGQLHGKTGVFPDNFVELLSEEKPKKPAPPSVPMQPGKARIERPPPPDPVKLPDKPPPPQPDKVKKEEKSVPSLPSKKPVFPPPVSKKPVKLSSQTDDDKAKEKEDPDEFDTIEATAKLSLPKRPKGPAKRPPSQLLRDQKEMEEEQAGTEELTGSLSNSSRKHAPEVVDRVPEAVKHPLPNTQAEQSLGLSSSPKTEPVTKEGSDLPGNSENANEIAALRNELLQLKQSSVSKEAFLELKQELATMKESLNGLKVHFNKRLMELMTEVDEEKKIRLSMQVEVERVHKLAMTS